MKKMNIKPSVAFRIAFVFVIAVLITGSVTSSLFARYTSDGDDSNSANVAKYSVSSGGTLLTESFVAQNLAPGYEDNKGIEITNNGEVDVKYTIIISSTGNLPLKFNWMEKKGTIEPNSTANETLNIKWADADSDSQYNNLTDVITVTVICVQAE
ncbi:MAG: hypothetical protein IJX51_00140 [Clostridia bacterium]|nr:hypothetical protein [Clostridia bacterium]